MSASLTFDWITLAEAQSAGVTDLTALHWAEVALKDFALDADWSAYRRLERAGVYKAIGSWSANRLVGYNSFIVQPPLHHRQSLWAINDILYLDPDQRKGLAGARLIRTSEEMLRTLGVKKVAYGVNPEVHFGHGKARANLGGLMRGLGYRHAESFFDKLL